MTILEGIAQASQAILKFPYIQRTRRNHGLEHATIHMLSKHHYSLSGRSSDAGFVLFGEVPTEAVITATNEALKRMRNGEHGLAIHPNCGTNLVTTGFLTTFVGLMGFSRQNNRSSWDRFPLIMVLMMATVLFSQPFGMNLQRHFTTEGDPGNLEILDISRGEMNVPLSGRKVTIHRVVTRQV